MWEHFVNVYCMLPLQLTWLAAMMTTKKCDWQWKKMGEPARLTLKERKDAEHGSWVDPQLIETVSGDLLNFSNGNCPRASKPRNTWMCNHSLVTAAIESGINTMNIELLTVKNVTLNDTGLYCSHLALHTIKHSWACNMQHSVPQQQAQRKRQRNKRCRDAYHDKLSSSKVPHLDENIPVARSSAESRTPAARGQVLSRAKSALPLSPRKYVETVRDLMNAATPRKRAIFEMQGQSWPVQLKIGRDVISSLQ